MKRFRRMMMTLATVTFTFVTVLAVTSWSNTPVEAAQGVHVNKEEVFLLPVPVHKAFKVIQVLSIQNASAVTQDVQVFVPAGATGLSVNNQAYSGRKAQGGAIVVSGAARSNATSDVTIAYSLPFDEQTGAQFSLRSSYAVDVAHLYLPIGNTAVSAQDLLTTTQTTNISGTECRVFTRLGIPAGDDWSISLQQLPTPTVSPDNSGLPVLGENPSDGQNILQAALNLALAAVVLAVGLISIRSTQYRRPKQALNTTEALYRALETNEVEWHQGMVAEQTYRQRRTQLVDKLVRLREEK